MITIACAGILGFIIISTIRHFMPRCWFHCGDVLPWIIFAMFYFSGLIFGLPDISGVIAAICWRYHLNSVIFLYADQLIDPSTLIAD